MVAVLGVGVVDASAPVIRADDAGVTRGDGCFEGCRLRDGVIDKLDAHLTRMARSAAALEIPFDEDAWRRLINEAIAAWPSAGEAAVKLLLTRGPVGGEPSGFVAVGPLPPDYPRLRRDGLKVITLSRGFVSDAFSEAPWLLGGVKSLSYAVNMAAQREALRRGADDVVFVSSDGVVLESPDRFGCLVGRAHAAHDTDWGDRDSRRDDATAAFRQRGRGRLGNPRDARRPRRTARG